MATQEVLERRLEEAEEALHKLSLGLQEVSVDVGGFGAVTYTKANAMDLRRYILDLKTKLGRGTGIIHVEF